MQIDGACFESLDNNVIRVYEFKNRNNRDLGEIEVFEVSDFDVFFHNIKNAIINKSNLFLIVIENKLKEILQDETFIR
jgi:hypothetical protein